MIEYNNIIFFVLGWTMLYAYQAYIKAHPKHKCTECGWSHGDG